MRRLFVALAMPEAVSEKLSSLLHGVPDARWVDPENFHLTLRFIGEVDGGVAEEIVGSLSRIRVPSFTLELAGLGHFDSPAEAASALVRYRAPILPDLQVKHVYEGLATTFASIRKVMPEINTAIGEQQ